MGRNARGVRGFDLDEGDIVVGAEALDPGDKTVTILNVTSKGYGKRTELEETIWIGGRSRALTAAAAATGGAVVVPKTSATT